MKYNWVEVITGALVLGLTLVFGLYIFNQSEGGPSGDLYPLNAQFTSAEGISSGGDIRMSGVKIGRVGSMELNTANYMADVELLIDQSVEIPADSEIKVASDGLLGGAFIEIIPGGDIVMLEEGDQFQYASGSISFLSLLASFVTNSADKE